MPPVRCPQCKFPLTPDESRAGACPFCGAAIEKPEKPRPQPGQPPQTVVDLAKGPPRSRAARYLIWGGVAAVALAVAGVWFHYMKSAVVEALKPRGGSRSEAVPGEAKTPAAVPPSPQVAKEAPPVPAKPPQPDKRPAPAPPVQAKPETPRAAQHVTVTGNETKIDSPDGVYVVPPLSGGREVTLSGRVKTLQVGAVDGASTLDAWRLEVQEVVFAGSINGGSTVRLRSPNASVEFRDEVNGQSRVNVSAPNGRVVFGGPAASRGGGINGESVVQVMARDVDFRGPIDGTRTHVMVTLTRGGTLRFTEVNGASRLHYTRADPNDPVPRIAAGRIKAKAEFRETW